jgi:Asp/Glu/hydantoin racemase
MQKINSLKDSIVIVEHNLTNEIEKLTKKKDRQEMISKMETEIKSIEKTFQNLEKANQKQKNKNIQRNAKIKLKGKNLLTKRLPE